MAQVKHLPSTYSSIQGHRGTKTNKPKKKGDKIFEEYIPYTEVLPETFIFKTVQMDS